MSKGSRPRPYSVSQETFANNYDLIFRKNKPTEAEKQSEAFLKDEYYDLEDEKSKPLDSNQSG
jgi:hypothetical protein